MANYSVRLNNGQLPVTVTAYGVQITETGVKFLNGKGKDAAIVAYFSGRVVESVVEVVE